MRFTINGRTKRGRTIGYISFSLMILAAMLAIIIKKTNIFEPKIIGQKYCYFYNKADSSSQFEQVMSSDDEQKSVELYNYYNNRLLNIKTVNNDLILDKVTNVLLCKKVDLLKYSKDSLRIQIRIRYQVEYRPGKEEVIGFVPAFTLHDSLPQKNNCH